MDNTILRVYFNASADDDTHFISCHAEFLLVYTEGNNEFKIGSASLDLINVFYSYGWSEVIYLADSVSGDLHEIIEMLAPILEDEDEFSGKLAILNSIEIQEEYRGQGYGSKALTKK